MPIRDVEALFNQSGKERRFLATAGPAASKAGLPRAGGRCHGMTTGCSRASWRANDIGGLMAARRAGVALNTSDSDTAEGLFDLLPLE